MADLAAARLGEISLLGQTGTRRRRTRKATAIVVRVASLLLTLLLIAGPAWLASTLRLAGAGRWRALAAVSPAVPGPTSVDTTTRRVLVGSSLPLPRPG